MICVQVFLPSPHGSLEGVGGDGNLYHLIYVGELREWRDPGKAQSKLR